MAARLLPGRLRVSRWGVARVGTLLLLLVLGLLPIYWMLVQSLKSDAEQVYGQPLWVTAPTLGAYTDVLTDSNFLGWAANTLIVLAGTTVVTVVSSLAAGYALAYLRLPSWRWIARLLLISYVVPQTLLFVPLYALVLELGLENNLFSLVLTYPMLAIPFCAWLFLSNFRGLPREIAEAARVEGGSEWEVFRQILLPISGPTIVAAVVFTVGVAASEFLYAAVFLPNGAHQTLAAGLGLTEVDPDQLGGVVAGANLAALPVILLCAALAPQYVRGLTAAMLEGA
jgi:multiple sugar transport system permease protein